MNFVTGRMLSLVPSAMRYGCKKPNGLSSAPVSSFELGLKELSSLKGDVLLPVLAPEMWHYAGLEKWIGQALEGRLHSSFGQGVQDPAFSTE